MVNITDPKKKVFEATERAVKESGQSFEELYNILFDRRGVFAETSRGSRLITYTYEYARDIIDRLASVISQKTKGRSTVIALYAENCPEWLFTFWAILKSGNKPCLVNLRQPAELSQGIIDTLGAEYVITINKPSPYNCAELTYNALSDEAKNIKINTNISFENEIYLTTSGTTLEQKICVYTGKEIAAQMLNSRDAVFSRNKMLYGRYKKNLKMLMVLPLYHIFGLEVSYLWYSIFGSVFVFPESLAPEKLLACIKKHKVTHVYGVPLLWQNVEKRVKGEIAQRSQKEQNKFKKGYKLSLALQNISPGLGLAFAKRAFKPVRAKLFGESIRFMITGGAYIEPSTLEFFSAIGYPLCNGYGMTEVGVPCLNASWRPKDMANCNIGKPFPSVEMKIGDNGNLFIKGESVCKRLIINGNEILQNEWFDTGDVARLDEKGNFCIIGRANDTVINESGENLNPDIAQRYFEIPYAKEFCVTGNAENKSLIIIVSLGYDLNDLQKQEISESIEKGCDKLPSAYKLSRILFTYQPLTDEGDIKISRTKLRAKLAEGALTFVELFEEECTEEKSGDEVYIKLKQILSRVLNLPEEEITANAHFMNDLGGTSLDYYTVLVAIEEEFGVKLAFEAQGFDYTLGGFERAIKELSKI